MGWHYECDCDEFSPNMAIILSGVNLLSTTHIYTKDLKEFKYCPYCGKKLIKRDNITNEILKEPKKGK